MRRLLVATAAAAVVAATAPAAEARSGHRALGVRFGDHPAFVRVVVDFAEGPIEFNQVDALDPLPLGDGRVRLRVAFPRITTQAPARQGLGVAVQIAQGTDELLITATARRLRFKYMAYFVLTQPDRLVIDLWKAAPPAPAAEVRAAPDRCLTLDRVSVLTGRVSAAGRERFLFEHSLVVRVRRADGRVAAERPVTAANGRWASAFAYRVAAPQRGTLEAVALSAKDGALDCIVQARATLRP